MSNNYFQFKQFRIEQDNCAMKVGTDGVLLGAWASCSGKKKVLDIGTGTGLIALMVAQRCSAFIDAIEIDLQAAKQAHENINNSPWSERVKIHHQSLQEYTIHCQTKYDLIICNPPFFSNSLKSSDKERNIARHNESLSLDALLTGVKKLIDNKGTFACVLPAETKETMIAKSEKIQLFPKSLLWIKPTLNKDPKRVLLEFSTLKSKCQEKFMTIERENRHEYTDEYIQMTREFYLAF